VIITESVLLQPFVASVTVNLYLVVRTGITIGFAIKELNPGGLLLHEYLFPEIADEPKVSVLPKQMLVFTPAFIMGRIVSISTTLSLLILLSLTPLGRLTHDAIVSKLAAPN